MKSPNTNLNHQKTSRGFTLIEILVGLVLAGIIISAAMSLYLTQHKQFIVQDEISDMQANIRAAAQELSSKIRMAGYNVPSAFPAIVASDTNPDTITIMYDSDGLIDVTIEHAMPQPSAELRCDGHDISPLQADDWVYIWDPFAKIGESFLVTHVQVASYHIQHNTMPLSRTYPVGSMLIMMNTYKYYIDNSNPDHPNLMIAQPGETPQIYAENITNLNLRYQLTSGAIVDVPASPDDIREVLIDIDGRTDRADDEFMTDYRTRSLSTRVKVRNLGF